MGTSDANRPDPARTFGTRRVSEGRTTTGVADETRTGTTSRFGDVLVATDLSSSSLGPIERAAQLPLAAGATLRVVHVLPDSLGSARDGEALEEARRSLDELAPRAVEIARGAGNGGLRVIPSVLVGRADVEIIRHARGPGAELIVLGRHGERSIRGLLLGSTAERVVRNADTPVLVVSHRPKRTYRQPLIALELSDVAHRIVGVASKVIDPRVRSVPVIHAYQVPFEGRMSLHADPIELAAYRAHYRDEARAGLRRLLESLDALDLAWAPSVRAGDPRSVILREARRRHADVIAVGTHARSGLSRALLGSVAESVIRTAPCDVLVVRPAEFSLDLP